MKVRMTRTVVLEGDHCIRDQATPTVRMKDGVVQVWNPAIAAYSDLPEDAYEPFLSSDDIRALLGDKPKRTRP